MHGLDLYAPILHVGWIKKPPPAPVRAKCFRPGNAFAPDTTWDGSKKTPPVVVRAKCFRPGNAFALEMLSPWGV